MDQFEILQRIEELEREIAALPPGSLTTKKVSGKKFGLVRGITFQTPKYVSFLHSSLSLWS